MTNQTGRNTRARRSLDKVCRNARTSTFRSDDHAFRPGSFDPVYPTPAILPFVASRCEFAPDLPAPGLFVKESGKGLNAQKFAFAASNNW